MKHVAYRGSQPAIQDLVAGQLQAVSAPIGEFTQQVNAGKARFLGVSGAERSHFVPGVPTFAEQGYKDLVFSEWFGFFAPGGTPAPVVQKINTALRAALAQKDVVDGWYDTGDVMRRDANGFVFFVGRADDMFQCGGENVYPGEIEKLLGRHPDVAQACVVPVADEIKYQLPVAFVVAKPGSTPSEDALRRFALDNGPAYAHPRAVWFVDELPLAGTNKIDRKALVDRAAAAYARDNARRV